MENTANSNISRYCNTQSYKSIFILSGYRNLLMLSGAGLVEKLRKHYRESPTVQHTCEPFSMNTVTLIDVGYHQLDEDEVRVYSDYIAEIMKYNKDKFYELLKKRAKKLKYYENDAEKSAKQRIKAMSWIEHKINIMGYFNRSMNKSSNQETSKEE